MSIVINTPVVNITTLDQSTIDLMNEISNKLDIIVGKEVMLMSKFDDINALLSAVDNASNVIAAKIEALMQQISGGLTATEAQAVNDQLSAEVAKLQALGSDPANPVP